MRNTKKAFALLLTAIMAASLASCGGSNGSTTTESSKSDTGASTSKTESTASTESSAEEVVTDPGEVPDVELPLTTEPVTLTYWVTFPSSGVTMNDLNENAFYQEMEKRTGVHLEFQMISSTERQTNFNLLIASNSLTDLIYTGASLYSEGVDAAIDDGYFMDLTDKIPEYMPHYQAIRMSDEEYYKLSTTDSGRMGAVYEFRQSKQGPWLGMWMRQDWLDKVNMEIPETYDEWHDVLAAFKDQCGATAPLILNWSGSDAEIGMMSAGYGVYNKWQLDADGNVNYGPYMDGWKDYVTTMHQWYTEGLIDPDFMATDQRMPDMTAVVTGATGAFTSLYTYPPMYESSSEDPNMNLTAVNPPVVNKGDTLHIRLRDSYTSGNTAISAECENWEIALKWLDYLYTEEGARLANYGIEGDTYTMVDGKPLYTDKILNAPDGTTMAQAMDLYLCPSAGIANWSDWTRELQALPEKCVAAYDVWGKADMSYTLPNVSLTQEESVERAAIFADASTYVKEKTAQFISGALDIESNWDQYIADLKSMNIERAIEITQAAYDRYQAR